MRAKVEIAFRRKVRVVWLDHGLTLASQGLAWREAKPTLACEVAAENPGAETIRKVLEHIRRIWFEPPVHATALRDDGFKVLSANDSPSTRFLLNWGMTIAAYPFVGGVAEAIGRLFSLQQQALRTEIQRRLQEQYGERDFVSRITRYNVSSLLDWGVILEANPKGKYLPGKTFPINRQTELAWLAEAVLISRRLSQISVSQLRNHPILFPLSMDLCTTFALLTNPRLSVQRQSLNDEFLHIESTKSSQHH